MGQDRQNAQIQVTRVSNALDKQRVQSANLVQLLANNAEAGHGNAAPAVPTSHVSAAAVKSIPCFEGKSMDSTQDFVDFVDRVAVAEGLTDLGVNPREVDQSMLRPSHGF